MPILSMFYGIVVKMYKEQDAKHKMPHLHAEYAEHQITVSLDGEKLAGDFPVSKSKLLVAWIEIHKDELMADWNLLSAGEKYFRIEPLK